MRFLRYLRDLDRAVILRVSCVVALIALGLIAWSLLDPRPIPVIVAMSVAQLLGTLSFVAFLFVVARDLRPFASHAPALSPAPAPAEKSKTISSE